MKLFIFISYLFFSGLLYSQSTTITPKDILEIQKKYNIKINDLSFSLAGSDQSIKFLRDHKGDLRRNDGKNFLLAEEKIKVKDIKKLIEYNGGSRVGNGGDVVVCGEEVVLLDSLRARKFSKNVFSIKEHESYEESLNEVIEKLKVSIPHLAESLFQFVQLYQERNSFSDMIFWSPENILIDIKDEQLVSELPQGCELNQVVVRLKTQRKVFFFNQRLMKSLSQNKDELSWLLIHEWLWDYLSNASDVRDVNHFFHSQYFINASDIEIMSYLNQFKLNITNDQIRSSIENKALAQKYAVDKLELYIDRHLEISPDSHDEYRKLYDGIKTKIADLKSENLSADLKRALDKIIGIYKSRIKYLNSQNSSVSELKFLSSIIELGEDEARNSNIFSFYSFLYSLFSIEETTTISRAKIYIQNKALVFPWNVSKRLTQVDLLDERYYSKEISLQTYLTEFFKIFHKSVPYEFQNV